MHSDKPMTKKISALAKKKILHKIIIFLILILLIALIAYFYKRGAFENAKNSVQSFVENQIGDTVIKEKLESFFTDENQPGEEEPYVVSNDTETLIDLPEGLELPVCGAKNHADDHELRKFNYYSICYREAYEQAEWSAYSISYFQLVKEATRSNDFRADGEISTGSASLADYKGSGFDRGHLTPAADMSFDALAMSETFFMSNMSPQAPQFNRGIWKELEAEVRQWTAKFGKVYVVSGPVLDKPASAFKAIGENGVSVPDFYYKVILVPLYKDDEDKATLEDSKSVMSIGFIIPNEKCEDDFWSYAVCVDAVEAATGLDFYSLLPDEVEGEVEKAFDLDLWK